VIYIKLDENMNLSITKYEPIYRGDHLNQKIIYLIPPVVGDIHMASASLYLSYIRADGTADIVLLRRLEEKYNETYCQYALPVTSTLSRYPGQICTWLQIYSGPPTCPVIAKSSECLLQVLASQNMDDYISDRNLSLIYEMQRKMEEKIEKTEESLSGRLEEGLAKKSDSLIFHGDDSTIQLAATTTVLTEDGEEESVQTLLGDPIFVRTNRAASIIDLEINSAGELVVVFEDETGKNLGPVGGIEFSIEKQDEMPDGFCATYRLKRSVGGNSSYAGDEINIPEDMSLLSGTLETVTHAGVPYDDAVVGEKYVDLILNDTKNTHIYVPSKWLESYAAGQGFV